MDKNMSMGSKGRELRSRIGVPVNAAFPRLSWNVWGARRSLSQLSVERAASGVRNQWRQRVRPGSTQGVGPAHLLYVVPASDRHETLWEPGVGNHTYELVMTAREFMGDSRVSCLYVDVKEPADQWHARVRDFVTKHDVTHLMAQAERDPSGSGDWSWDVLLKDMRGSWGGAFIALTYDSAYPYLLMHIERISRVFARTLVVALDRPLTGLIRPERPTVGPVFLPISSESLHVLDEATKGVQPEYDVTFLGNVNGYPFRAELLDELARAGIDVTINPQAAPDGGLPGFSSYVVALKRSRITVNFSRCNGVPVTQLKTRILEAPLFGAVVVSDSPLYAQDYFALGDEFLAYDSPQDLLAQLDYLFSDPAELVAMAARAQVVARDLCSLSFWRAIDVGLSRRGLPTLR